MERRQYSEDPEMNQRYILAKKKTENIRKFYKHLVVYIVVNLFISGFKIKEYMRHGDTFEEALLQFDVFVVWIIWGAFVLLQALKTFKSRMILSADWEERKIQEYMNEDKR